MKKKAITLLLSIVLASGSIGNVQVLAAETTEQEAEPVQEEETTEQEEEPVQEEETAEEADTENFSEDVSEPEEKAELVQEDEDSGTEEAVDEEEFDTSEDAAADVLEIEEAELSDESEDAQADIVASGKCGFNLIWSLTGAEDDLTLTISREIDDYNEMDDYSHGNPPWYPYRTQIKRIIIEKGVYLIGNYAFKSLVNLTAVRFASSVDNIGEGCFSDCTSLRMITIPPRVLGLSTGMFKGCTSLISVTFPYEDSIYAFFSLAPEAFKDCSSLKSINLPETIDSIDSGTFSGCSSLKTITLPENVERIDQNAFEGCISLNSITFNNIDKINYIGGGAFKGCSSLTNFTIPERVSKIKRETFSGCSSLADITIPAGVKKIEWSAFEDCSSLVNITIPANVTQIDAGAFSGCSSLESFIIPENVLYISTSLFSGCSSLKSIVIPEGVTTIYETAFSGCSSLTSITIPDSVTKIDSHAFDDCTNLSNLVLSDNIQDLGNGVFCNHSKSFIIYSHNPYVLGYCKDNNYGCFDKTAPTIKKASAYNGSEIRIDIGKRADASGYQIKYADNNKMTDAKSIMIKDNKTLSKDIKGLENGKTYYIQIQTFQKIGDATYWSKWSPIKNVTVGQTPYPTNVTKLSTYIGSHIKADWTKTDGASGYHIKYADNSSMNGAKEVMVKGNSTFTKTLTGLKNGKTYYVKIQTYRTVSGKTYWSSWSPVKSIMVDQKPYGSSISKLTNPSSKAMKITWDKAPSATGYHIQYATNSNMTGAKDIMVNNKDTLTKTVTGLSKGKTYYVRIQTFRKVSGKTYWSSWSKAKQIKITK